MLELSEVLPIGNRRYSRLETCATLNTYREEREIPTSDGGSVKHLKRGAHRPDRQKEGNGESEEAGSVHSSGFMRVQNVSPRRLVGSSFIRS